MQASDKDSDDPMPRDNEELKTKKDRYKVLALLGKGGYGAVYSVTRLSDSERFAIKCENANAPRKSLYMDCNVLKGAAQIKSRHFCTVIDQAAVKDRFNFIVMKMIGKNLWDLRMDTPELRFSMGTALKAAAQCLVSIEQLHRFGYLHRDIKPGNFAAGRKETNEHHTIFMLDFGLCREYVKRGEGKVRLQRSSAPFRGTTRYAPLGSMMEMDTARKDDIESWLYMVVEWTSGQLPWHKLKSHDRDKVMQFKKDLRNKPEVQDDFFYDCPKKEFLRILKYVDSLGFYSTPDYKFVYFCIQHAGTANNVKDTDPLDWDASCPFNGPIESPEP
uniref:Protein kinase domain-containing protein n=1 Tax=Caenorhabditis japonica TaxID=281687 RepID=A0A8R1DIR3_CAEJA